MACPYFFPVARIENSGFAIPPRLPLGDAYSGECRAANAIHIPQEPMLGAACNTGYGRGACERFPTDFNADAVRFHVSAESAATVILQFVFEKDCWPSAHGLLSYSAVERRFVEPAGNPVLQRQAEAFLESYRRRTLA